VRPEDGTLVFLDFGMMGIIQPEQKLRILEIFVDVINQRPENLKDNLIALGCLRPDARWEELVPVANNGCSRHSLAMPRTRHSFQEVTSSFAPLIYEYEFRIPVDFALHRAGHHDPGGHQPAARPRFRHLGRHGALRGAHDAHLPRSQPAAQADGRAADGRGGLDWGRLQQLALLAAHDTAFRLETEGLVEPALDMLLSPEGAALRQALIADLVSSPGWLPVVG
jgi:hypothetical protein